MEIEQKIKEICEDLEKDENIKILFAIESGSRAWRFQSANSDYDVRFVFVRPLNEYIKLNKHEEVISVNYDEQFKICPPEKALIDIVGFDIFKFLNLLSKSNPTAIEWLMSDIIYYGEPNKVFQKFALNNFNEISLYSHYLSLARNNFRPIKTKKNVTYKKYLYVLRGLINAQWILYKKSIPPIIFENTIREIENLIPKEIVSKIYEIISIKIKGNNEKETIENDADLDNFIENFLNELYNKKPLVSKKKINLEELNKELRNILLSRNFKQQF